MKAEVKYANVLRAISETSWAILPHKLAALIETAALYAAGGEWTAEEIAARTGSPRAPGERSAGSVAILPLFGTIFPRANLMTQVSGATSVEQVTARFRDLLADPNVSAIVLDVDSPGGAVNGVDELAGEILKARGQKPVIAVANHLAASAAYWIASAADEVVVTPSGEVGSIGIFAAHEDLSAALEAEGVKISLVSAGKYKTEGNPYEPLSEEARAALQARVDEHYTAFVKTVARGRGVSASDVRGGFGEGRVVGAKEAVRLGMADRVGTLDETIDRLARGRKSTRGAAADKEFRQRRLRLASHL
jgi:capsid assembly protease